MLKISKFDIFNFTAAERDPCILHGNVNKPFDVKENVQSL